VEKVSDGDTITLLTADYERVKVRLYGLDAPENKQPYGEQSKAALKNILERQQVIVEEIDVDHYSRVVGLVRLDGQLVNLSMVAGGYAWLYPQYCKLKDVCRALSEAESTAKKKRLGLWETSAPMPPWDWRKAQRAR
jgi:endonuclease YncB( thermonuclease family)